jgi:hypothetical protein
LSFDFLNPKIRTSYGGVIKCHTGGKYMNGFKFCINAVDPSYLKDGTIMKQFVVINVKAKNTTDNILFIYNFFAYLS